MLIWLASYPRSGNTFFRILLRHLYGIQTYSVYNDPLFKEIGIAELVGHRDLSEAIDELRTREGACLVKTHSPVPQTDDPVIYLVRDGRDALVSYARYQMSFGKRGTSNCEFRLTWPIVGALLERRRFLATLRQLIISTEYYGGWSNHVLNWLTSPRSAPLAVVRYEDLVSQPVTTMNSTLTKVGLRIAMISNEIPSFSELHAAAPAFFRRGHQGTWQAEMPKYVQRLFWEYHAEGMKVAGYSDGEVETGHEATDGHT